MECCRSARSASSLSTHWRPQETTHRRCTEAGDSQYKRAAARPTRRGAPFILLVKLRSRFGPRMDLVLRATLLPLGARMDCRWGAQAPTGPGPRGGGGGLHPPQTEMLPGGRAHAGGKGLGPPRAKGDANPSQHRALQGVAKRTPISGGRVGGDRRGAELADVATKPVWSR